MENMLSLKANWPSEQHWKLPTFVFAQPVKFSEQLDWLNHEKFQMKAEVTD